MFDEPHRHVRLGGLDMLRQAKADIAAADDDQPARLRLFMAEGGHRPGHMIVGGDEVDLVAGQHLVVAAGHDRPVAPDDGQDFDAQIGEQPGELA